MTKRLDLYFTPLFYTILIRLANNLLILGFLAFLGESKQMTTKMDTAMLENILTRSVCLKTELCITIKSLSRKDTVFFKSK